MIDSIVKEISSSLLKNTPQLSEDQKDRMYKILNPDISDYIIYYIRIPEIEKIVKSVHGKFVCSYSDAVEVFKRLTRTRVEEKKFAGFFFLNRFKKYFNETTVDLIRKEYAEHCHTWSNCDSMCVRLLGPFLGKKGNEALAIKTINNWSESKNLWVKRASMVILLKIIMMSKDFDKDFVFKLVEKMLKYTEQNYIGKGIGWLLKECSKYKPDLIFDYLMKNKNRFSRLILRTGSEKLPKYEKDMILNKIKPLT